MKNIFNFYSLRIVLASISLLGFNLAYAAPLVIANAPLIVSGTQPVLPNLMYILDNSGSMGQDYTPDWVDDNYCRNAGGTYIGPCGGQPPFRSPDYNSQYYNPEIRYQPAINANSTPFPSQTSWTSVKNDAFNVQSTGSTNLVTSYGDQEWCTNSAKTDCLRNSNYVLPGFVNGKSYYTLNTTSASGTKILANGTSAGSLTNKVLGPHYYKISPFEYCDSDKLTNCQPTSSATFSYPAKVRWCDSFLLTNCKGLRTGNFTYPRYPTVRIPKYSTVTISNVNSNTRVNSVTVGGQQILGDTDNSTGNYGSSNNSRTVADRIAANINLCTTAIFDECQVRGYSAISLSGSGSTGIVYIFVPDTVSATPATPVITKATGTKTVTPTAFTTTTSTIPGTFTRVDILSSGTYTKGAGRSDCLANPCTGSEEMTNFANWFTYYRTRMQSMKTSTSRAFESINQNYRVGFMTINDPSVGPDMSHLPIDTFNPTQKTNWYTSLFGTAPGAGTPLRAALGIAGRNYAGKLPFSGFTVDPVQYACQQNFTLLTTDGYWNGGGGADINGNAIGNRDSSAAEVGKWEGTTASSGSLADVAKYYFDTDIRDDSFSNCNGAIAGVSVCEDADVLAGTKKDEKQNMITYTLGLGIDGSLNYTSNYKTDPLGDFAKINKVNPSLNWPVPAANSETAIDDLWHAAVNGEGTYFSAKDPDTLTKSLKDTLNDIGAKIGAGSAAATSTLNPVAGDNYAYLASYVNKRWTGNLQARLIDTTNGVVTNTIEWCVEDVVSDTSCTSPSTIKTITAGTPAVTTYYCSEPNQPVCNSPSIVDANGTSCNTKIVPSCNGKLANQLTRDIKMAKYTGIGGALANFEHANLSSAQQSVFASANLSLALSHWGDLTVAQQDVADNPNILINYLRGDTTYDDGASAAANRLFRQRSALLGDAVDSSPKFAGKATASYTDLGYGPATLAGSFANGQLTRSGTVYLGTNDGMLHAFNANGSAATNPNIGEERWAFIPSAVIPKLPELADRDYDNAHHVNYVNGDIVIADVCSAADCSVSANASDWKTILVGGLNGGGVGYYALDITDPNNPKLLWEFGNSADFPGDTTFDDDMGLSFGNPVITKKQNGKWVVLFTSGYNNLSGSNPGKGFLYVVDATTGAKISKIATGEGTATAQSGLAKINVFASNTELNNTAGFVYGGDLLGNVWRFDINTEDKFLFAELEDSSGNPQPITTGPELGLVNGKTIVLIGTGKYLEDSDRNNTQKQSFYAIVEKSPAATVSGRSTLVNKNFNKDGSGNRSIGNTANVDYDTKRGWFIDFIDNGERVNVKPRLELGAILLPSIVPSAATCSPGGFGYLNILGFQNGNAVPGNAISKKYGSPIVGINVVYIGGKPVASAVTADDPVPKKVDFIPPNSTSGFQKKRVIWRELTD